MGLGRLPMPLRLQGHDEGGRGFAAMDWVDGGNIPTGPFNLEEALGAVEATVGAWTAAGARTLILGGDHLMTLGALRAQARRHVPLGLLHLDAHPDAAQHMEDCPWWAPFFTIGADGKRRPTHPSAPTR